VKSFTHWQRSQLRAAAGMGKGTVFAAALAAILIPDAVIIVLFSSMVGIAPTVSNTAAPAIFNSVGNMMGGAAFGFLGVLYVIDFHLRNTILQVVLGLLLGILVMGTGVLKSLYYPWVPGLFCLCFSVVTVGWQRAKYFKRSNGYDGQTFFGATAASYAVAAFVILAAYGAWIFVMGNMWNEETRAELIAANNRVYEELGKGVAPDFGLNHTLHCTDDVDLVNLTDGDDKMEKKILKACKYAQGVWFLQWSAPAVVFICNAVAGIFCFLFSRTASRISAASDNTEEENSDEAVKHLQRVLKACFLCVVLMLGFMYSSMSVLGASVSLGSAIMALGAACLAATLGWMYLELDLSVLTRLTTEGALANNVIKMMKSDWFKALVVGGMNLAIPMMAALDMLRKQQRLMTGAAENDGDSYTQGGRKVVNELSTWNWWSIFSKVDILGIIWFAMILGSKATFVLFSALNAWLASMALSFPILCVLVFAIGFCMFLNPIVPGSAVYLFAGIVMGGQTQLEGSVGFWPGFGAACAIGALAKHVACCAQYMIGYTAGQKVKVQQIAGVDKVLTRAIEKNLKKRGLSAAKVSILVAGPDWPTSVLCGILRLNIPQMLLGTFPVTFVSIIPQTLVGALLMLEGAENGIWGMISNGLMMAAGAVQGGATMYYARAVLKTVEQDGEALAVFRPEHAAVAELTAKEAAYMACRKECAKWRNLSGSLKGMLAGSAACMLMGGFIILLDFVGSSGSEKLVFRNFKITNDIGASFDIGGLDGNPLNLVMMPMGYGAVMLNVSGIVLNYLSQRSLGGLAQKMLDAGGPATVDVMPVENGAGGSIMIGSKHDTNLVNI